MGRRWLTAGGRCLAKNRSSRSGLVMEGRSLSDAMSKQPRIFSDLYVNMVRAGESSGALVEVLRRMADHFERFASVQAKFTSAPELAEPLAGASSCGGSVGQLCARGTVNCVRVDSVDAPHVAPRSGSARALLAPTRRGDKHVTSYSLHPASRRRREPGCRARPRCRRRPEPPQCRPALRLFFWRDSEHFARISFLIR